MVNEMSEWNADQLDEASRAWPELQGDEAKIRAALDKGVKLTSCSDEQRANVADLADELGIDLSPVKWYAAARDIDRIYLRQHGPDNTAPAMRELVRILKDPAGPYRMNANQVAAAIGIPPRFINGMYAAGVKAQATPVQATA